MNLGLWGPMTRRVEIRMNVNSVTRGPYISPLRMSLSLRTTRGLWPNVVRFGPQPHGLDLTPFGCLDMLKLRQRKSKDRPRKDHLLNNFERINI